LVRKKYFFTLYKLLYQLRVQIVTPVTSKYFIGSVFTITMLCGSFSPRHSANSGCGWRRRTADMEDSCEYIE